MGAVRIPRRLRELLDVDDGSIGEGQTLVRQGETFVGADGLQGPQGDQGDVGAQGPVGPAGEGFEFEGVWLVGTAYEANDVVHHDGAAWVALQGSTGEEPGVGSVFWDEFAVQGAEGVQGPQGPAGVDGDDGAQGPQGVQGVPGADGDDGAQGPQGDPGPDNVIVGKTVPPLTADEDGMGWVYDHASGAMVWTQLVAEGDPRLSDARAPTAHTHDDRYYTEAEADARYGRILAQSAVAVSHTGDTAETTLATITVPANALGPTGRLRVTSTWSFTGSAFSKTLRGRFSGAAGSAYLQPALTTTQTYRGQFEVANRNATNSQVGAQQVAHGGWGTASPAVITSAADTTAATTVVLTAQLALASETITLESYLVELFPGA